MRSTSLVFDKRGSSVLDVVFIVVVLLILGLAFFFVKFAFSSVNSDIQSDSDITSGAKSVIGSANSSFGSVFDFGFGFIFFGLIVGILITAYFVNSHPVFFIISVVLFVFVIFVGANVTNVFEDTIGDADFVAIQSEFPIMLFIMDNLIVELCVAFALMCVVLYGKSGSGY